MTATPAETPADIELVRHFVNTIDVEDGTDAISTPADLRRWLVGEELLEGPGRATADHVALALALRDALRRQLVHHHDDTCDCSLDDELDALFMRLPLRASAAEAGALVPVDGGVAGALERVVAACVAGRMHGTFDRLKICPAEDCLWAFYDSSRNRSKRWCSMGVCGNRSKVRTYRARADD
jgi:predicted RNA-binding Zn ribbon-like protein